MKPQNAPITDTDVEIDDCQINLPNHVEVTWPGRAAIFRQGERRFGPQRSVSTSILHSDPYSSVVL
jgi:hypothetical protein